MRWGIEHRENRNAAAVPLPYRARAYRGHHAGGAVLGPGVEARSMHGSVERARRVVPLDDRSRAKGLRPVIAAGRPTRGARTCPGRQRAAGKRLDREWPRLRQAVARLMCAAACGSVARSSRGWAPRKLPGAAFRAYAVNVALLTVVIPARLAYARRPG